MTGEDFEVVGGSHDIEADTDDMMATGGTIRSLGGDVGGVALNAHGLLADGNLLSSAVLSPGSFASAESALLGVLDGGGGLTSNAVKLTATGLFMQGKADAWRAFDQAQEFGEEVRHWGQGTLAAAVLATPLAWPLAGGATAAYLWQDGALDDPQAYLVSHPDLLEEIVASAPFSLSALSGGVFPSSVEQTSGLLAMLWDQGDATVTPVTDGTEKDYHDPKPPRSLQESLQTLDDFNEPGRFQIQRTQAPDGEFVYNVYFPGTKIFDGPFDADLPAPLDGLEESDYIQNMGSNLAGVAGVDNAYQDAVLKALDAAGVPHDARLVFTGHSQGGIVAARLAEQVTDPSSGAPQYNVTNVVTAGSPVDHIDLPESVQMVSLVNEYDIVPRLDGEKYDDSSNHTTIIGEHQTGTVQGNHLIAPTYAPMAGQLEESTDPAVQDALAPLSAFYTGDQPTTWTYDMEREGR